MKKVKIYSNIYKNKKWKGIIDYRVGAFLVGYICIMYQILNYIGLSAIYTVYVILMSCIPLLGIYAIVGGEENIPQILYNIFKYAIRSKNYIFNYNKET